MTKEEILAMEPNEEMDTLVAVEVMNESMSDLCLPEDALELQLAGSPIKSGGGNWFCLCEYEGGDIPRWHPLQFSSDISAAWHVVNKMLDLGFCLELYTPKPLSTKWSALYVTNVSRYHTEKVYTDEAPEAICKAALLTRSEDEIKKLEVSER